MATIVEYQHQIEYAYDRKGKRFPRLDFRMSTSSLTDAVDVEAYLDNGCEYTLFNGWLGASLGLDLLSGRRRRFQSASGSFLEAAVHSVHLVHDDLGVFELEVAFSLTEIQRCLLGRDFFNLAQIGFRERYQYFFVTPEP
jgi:hypothetical protein